MRRNYIIFAFILTVITQTLGLTKVCAQNIKNIEKQMLKYEYAKSAVLLKKIIEKNGKHTQTAMEKLATCYRFMNEPEKAANWYEKVIEIEGSMPENHFYYAQMLRMLGKYEEAKSQFLKFDSLVPNNKMEALALAQLCEDIIPRLKESDKFTLVNVGNINTAYSEFSPVIYKDSIVFTSDRPKSDEKNEIYSWTGSSYLDLYASELKYSHDRYATSNPAEFNSDLSQTYHDGTAVFSNGWNTVIFTRATNERVKKGNHPIATNVLKLYESHFVNGHWTEPKPFFLNSDDYSVGHPAISVDGKKLYFVSDMPGGFGGTDLYVCTLENNQWTNVKNLGSKINTSGNEMFPYVSNDGSLYFSSTNHLGYGGLDVFKTKQANSGWETPENLGAPMNSSFDDFGITFISEEQGFVSSNRPGGTGSDDIYSFERIIIAPPAPTMISGRVISDQGSVLKNATIFLLNNNTDKVQILKTDYLGKYSVEVEKNTRYTLLSKKTNFLDDCVTVQVNEDSENPKDLVLEKLTKKKVIAIENIYYDFDKWDIKPESEIELNHLVKILKENSISIELGSHTDSRGTEKYNQVLSQKRAQSAVNYIISQGIDSSRILAKGYGETQLINTCSDGVTCTEEAHQLNRRTEFKIIDVKVAKSDSGDSLNKFVEGDILNKSEFEAKYFDKCKQH